MIKFGKTSFNKAALIEMKKEDFVKIYKDTNLFNVNAAWKHIQAELKKKAVQK